MKGSLSNAQDADFYNFHIPIIRSFQNDYDIEVNMDLPEGSNYNLTLYDEYGNQVGKAEWNGDNRKSLKIPNWDTSTNEYSIKIENESGKEVAPDDYYKISFHVSKSEEHEKTDAITEAYGAWQIAKSRNLPEQQEYLDRYLGSKMFNFSVDPLTKKLTVSLMNEADGAENQSLLQQMEQALNNNKNGRNLFFDLLYEGNDNNAFSKAELLKYSLMSEFHNETGLDIRNFTKTENGYVNDKGENALDLYKDALSTSQNVPAIYKGDAYSFFKELVDDSMKYDLEDIPDLVLSVTYQNGVIVNNNLDTQQAGSFFNASV